MQKPPIILQASSRQAQPAQYVVASPAPSDIMRMPYVLTLIAPKKAGGVLPFLAERVHPNTHLDSVHHSAFENSDKTFHLAKSIWTD